jgi:hypothetical protein
MVIVSFYLIIGFLVGIETVSIPFVRNAYYRPSGTGVVNTTMRFNSTCANCLCEYFGEASDIVGTLALNCFGNDTCEFIHNFAPSFKLVPLVGAKLYFQQNILPEASTCCMPNITEVLARLKASIPIIVNLTFTPGAIGYDESTPDQAVTLGNSVATLYWFNPHNLQFIRSSSTWTKLSVVLYQGLLFTSLGGTSAINILTSENATQLANITHPSLSNTRKLIFLNDGQTMITTAQNAMSLSLFERNSPINYTFQVSVTPFLRKQFMLLHL